MSFYKIDAVVNINGKYGAKNSYELIASSRQKAIEQLKARNAKLKVIVCGIEVVR